MSNQNELRLAHLRLDRIELRRMIDSYNRLSPETRDRDTSYFDMARDSHMDIGGRLRDVIRWARVQITEMESTDE